jgi:hypothetical protein
MQRTVKATKFTYAKTELINGELVSELATIEVPETDHKKALKKAFKEVGTFAPLKTETTENLYILDDEIFFRYAVKAEPKSEKAEG